jgi:hypothetical protein
MYRILWHGDRGDELGSGKYATIREAVGAAEQIRRGFVQRPGPGYDVVWADTGHSVPDWFRQAELGF